MLEPTPSGKDTNNIQTISSTCSCSSLLSEVMFQLPITSLWQDCCSRAASKPPGVETICAVPIRPLRCVLHAKWISAFAWLVEETVAYYSSESLCIKPERGSCWSAGWQWLISRVRATTFVETGGTAKRCWHRVQCCRKALYLLH